MKENSLIKNKAILELLDKYQPIWSLNHLITLANWDIRTYMPEEGIEARGNALAEAAKLSQTLFLKEDFISLIEKAGKEKDLNDHENAILRILKRGLKFYQRLPRDFIEEYTKATNDAHLAWKSAKEESNFKTFEPHLEKIVELTRKKAKYLGYEKHPYDALLDEYEEGLTTEEVEGYFNSIKKPIAELINYIKKSGNYGSEHALEKIKYDEDKMKELTKAILNLIHYNMNHLRIDTSSHPFSTNIGKGDHRITTRFEGKDFARSYSGTIHEYGHALYDIQSHEDLHYTPIGGGSSLVIHESQSRFWENFVGKSEAFISLLYNEIIKANDEYKNYSPREIYNYMNLVKPSLIRMEADEVTYHLHVLIRFEIEKELIEGKIKVKDLPKIWNDKYEQYLGIRPENDQEGVLQDIHWSDGSIGYFPTYSIGTALSAIWKIHLENEIGRIDDLAKSKDGIGKIQKWLKEKIHRHGSTYIFRDIVKKMTGEEFSSRHLIEYLEEKYKRLY